MQLIRTEQLLNEQQKQDRLSTSSVSYTVRQLGPSHGVVDTPHGLKVAYVLMVEKEPLCAVDIVAAEATMHRTTRNAAQYRRHRRNASTHLKAHKSIGFVTVNTDPTEEELRSMDFEHVRSDGSMTHGHRISKLAVKAFVRSAY